jgi:hypothetical protein
MKKTYSISGSFSLFILAWIFIFNSCSSPEIHGYISDEGLVEVFPAGLNYSDGNDAYAEVSAVVFDGKNLIFGNDKSIPSAPEQSYSSVFQISENAFPSSPEKYFVSSTFLNATKYEDFTISPEHDYIFATTGFDRIHPSGSAEWDHFNTLLCWPVNAPEKVQVVSPVISGDVSSSVGLRQKISKALANIEFPDGVPYFKIEGLAALPNRQLLFGIREFGENYKLFNYSIKILSTSYEIDNGIVVLPHEFKLIYDISPELLQATINQFVAISSLEYDPINHQIFLLTSYENNINNEVTDEGIGAFLWVLTPEDLKNNLPPTLVLNANNSLPLHFAHKAEGLTVIDKNTVLLVHDDDRVCGHTPLTNPETQFYRKANEMAWTIVKFK